MIDVLLDFTQKAGKRLKLKHQNIDTLCFKSSRVSSLVTKSDIYISTLFAKTIQKHFSHLNYMIIDEETITHYGADIFKTIDQTEFQFVIDPIDGTLQYANNHPLFGISIGVYKNKKPLLGIIYLPILNELVYSDGKKAFWVQNSFKKNEIKTELLPGKKPTPPIIFGHLWFWRLTDNFSTNKALFLNYFSAVSQSFYPLIGKARAYCMKLHLWDIAGTIPIADYLGLKIHEYGSSKVYDKISSEYFNTDMTTKKHCILCHPEDFNEICSFVEPTKKQ